MQGYILRRILLLIPTIILVTIMVFFLVRFIPGDVIDVMLAEQQAFGHTTVDRAELEHRLGLDVPVYIQYFRWIWAMLQGDLGVSLWSTESVIDSLVSRIPVSLELGLIAIIIGQAVAIPIGVISAIRQDTPQDYVGRIMAILFLCLPNFWL
ncbi:MAG: ABC transporter permease [Dehalococcoidales bacterium]|nr:ABC transporter permease [Dehalococcoidales bacterium]